MDDRLRQVFDDGFRAGRLEGLRAGYADGHRAGFAEGLKVGQTGAQGGAPAPYAPGRSVPPGPPAPVPAWNGPWVRPGPAEGAPPPRPAPPPPTPEELAAEKERRNRRNLNGLLYVATFLLVGSAAALFGGALPPEAKLAGIWAWAGLFFAAGIGLATTVRLLRPASLAFTWTGIAILPFGGAALAAFTPMSAEVAWHVTSIMALLALAVTLAVYRHPAVAHLCVLTFVTIPVSASAAIRLPLASMLLLVVVAATAATVGLRALPGTGTAALLRPSTTLVVWGAAPLAMVVGWGLLLPLPDQLAIAAATTAQYALAWALDRSSARAFGVRVLLLVTGVIGALALPGVPAANLALLGVGVAAVAATTWLLVRTPTAAPGPAADRERLLLAAGFLVIAFGGLWLLPPMGSRIPFLAVAVLTAAALAAAWAQRSLPLAVMAVTVSWAVPPLLGLPSWAFVSHDPFVGSWVLAPYDPTLHTGIAVAVAAGYAVVARRRVVDAVWRGLVVVAVASHALAGACVAYGDHPVRQVVLALVGAAAVVAVAETGSLPALRVLALPLVVVAVDLTLTLTVLRLLPPAAAEAVRGVVVPGTALLAGAAWLAWTSRRPDPPTSYLVALHVAVVAAAAALTLGLVAAVPGHHAGTVPAAVPHLGLGGLVAAGVVVWLVWLLASGPRPADAAPEDAGRAVAAGAGLVPVVALALLSALVLPSPWLRLAAFALLTAGAAVSAWHRRSLRLGTFAAASSFVLPAVAGRYGYDPTLHGVLAGLGAVAYAAAARRWRISRSWRALALATVGLHALAGAFAVYGERPVRQLALAVVGGVAVVVVAEATRARVFRLAALPLGMVALDQALALAGLRPPGVVDHPLLADPEWTRWVLVGVVGLLVAAAWLLVDAHRPLGRPHHVAVTVAVVAVAAYLAVPVTLGRSAYGALVVADLGLAAVLVAAVAAWVVWLRAEGGRAQVATVGLAGVVGLALLLTFAHPEPWAALAGYAVLTAMAWHAALTRRPPEHVAGAVAAGLLQLAAWHLALPAAVVASGPVEGWVLAYLHLVVVALGVPYLRWRPTSDAPGVVLAALLTYGVGALALVHGGAVSLVFLAEQVGLLVVGALLSRRWLAWWGGVAATLALVHFLRDYLFVNLALLGALLIGVVVWRLVRMSREGGTGGPAATSEPQGPPGSPGPQGPSYAGAAQPGPQG